MYIIEIHNVIILCDKDMCSKGYANRLKEKVQISFMLALAMYSWLPLSNRSGIQCFIKHVYIISELFENTFKPKLCVACMYFSCPMFSLSIYVSFNLFIASK